MGTIVFAMFASVPFYYIWNKLAPAYFYWLPVVYQHLPFWHVMGLLVIVAIVRVLVLPGHDFGHEWKHHHRWQKRWKYREE